MKDEVWLSGFKLMPKQLRTILKKKQNMSIEIRLKEIEEQEEQRVENLVAQKKTRGRLKKGEQEKEAKETISKQAKSTEKEIHPRLLLRCKTMSTKSNQRRNQ